MTLQLDNLIDRLLTVGLQSGTSLTKSITEDEIGLLCATARSVLLSQPVLIEVEPPIKVCGDLHGQYNDLLRLFNHCGFPPKANYMFLGDYVDRGKQSLETICLLFAYKIKYPDNMFLLLGNHECAMMNKMHGFYEECNRRYSVRLWETFLDVFNCLPLCGLIAGRIFCMHGGLSPELTSWDQVRAIQRPCDPSTPSSLEFDLLWADPGKEMSGWQKNPRGASYVFGADVVVKFCERMDVDLVARGHQVVQDGYEFFADRHLVTIFSAPNYNNEFDNAAAVMTVTTDLLCSFDVLRPIRVASTM